MRLVIRDLNYSYRPGGRRVLSNLNFTAESGSYWCLAGPNGSGKSTVLRLVAGLLPTALTMTGEILWNDQPMIQYSRLEMARNVGFVAGTLKSHFPVTVSDFVLHARFAHGSAFWSRPTAADSNIAAACIERVGIASLAEASIAEISAGELQLAMIARAITQEPKILILDEATANLDLRYQARIFELLAELNKQGMSIFVVTHDLNLAAEFCPNVLWLNDGGAYGRGLMSKTLTSELMSDLYDVAGKIEIGHNPFTQRLKIFWK